MEKAKITAVKIEMNRMAKRIRALDKVGKLIEGTDKYHYSPKETGAIKRASMDLSRALVDLRRR